VISRQDQLAGAFAGKVNIAVEDQLLDEAPIMKALFVNSSGREFSAADFERQVRVSVTNGKIVDDAILARNPDDLAIDINRMEASSLEFTKAIFKEGESLKFHIVADRANLELQIDGRVYGLNTRLVDELGPEGTSFLSR